MIASRKIPDLYLLLACLFFCVLVVPFQILESPIDYFFYNVPSGQFLYVCSKIAGFSAILLFGLQLTLGLLGLKIKRPKLHKFLGIALLLMVMLHVFMFIGAVSLRSGQLSLGLLIPTFSKGFYPLMVSLGTLAFWGIVAVVMAGFLYRNKGFGLAKFIHRCSILLFFLVSLHALQIGSESHNGMLFYLYIIEFLAVFSALCWRAYTFFGCKCSQKDNDHLFV